MTELYTIESEKINPPEKWWVVEYAFTDDPEGHVRRMHFDSEKLANNLMECNKKVFGEELRFIHIVEEI